MQYTAKDVDDYTEIVTSAEVIQHCYLPSDASTPQLELWIKSARKWVEKHCGVALVAKTVVVSYRGFEDTMYLPFATESTEITTLTYLDSNGDSASVNKADVVLYNIPTPAYILPKTTWPTSGSNIVITYTATQYYDYDIYKPAIMMLVAHLAENREIVESKFENSLINLLAPLRHKYQP